MHPYMEGVLLQASLILALGAQNIFVLESGLQRRRHWVVAFVCSFCDALLIAVGVAGAASVFVRVPALKIGFGAVGVGFLAFYGYQKLRAGLVSGGEPREDASAHVPWDLRRVVLLSLGFSLLNPHVYLDTVILVGGYSSRYPELSARLQFGAGAASFSALWFYGLAFFAAAMSSLLRSPRAWRLIALFSGVVLLGLAVKLGGDVLSWATSA